MNKLVAVTVTFNGVAVWQPFLECVLAQTHSDWELVIVDNGSSDGLRELLQQIDDTRVTVMLSDRNTGITGGNNQGIAFARARGAGGVLLLNYDTEFGPTLFADLETSLAANSAAAISPLITFYDRPNHVWYGGGRFDRHLGVLNVHDRYRAPIDRFPTDPFRTEFAPACCLLVRSDVFDRVGVMDDQYFVYWDDADFAWRMKLAGEPIFVDPRLRLAHKVSASTGGALSDFTLRYHHRNQMVFARKFYPTGWTAYTLAVTVLIAAARIPLKGDSLRHARLRVAGLFEGLRLPLAPTLPSVVNGSRT